MYQLNFNRFCLWLAFAFAWPVQNFRNTWKGNAGILCFVLYWMIELYLKVERQNLRGIFMPTSCHLRKRISVTVTAHKTRVKIPYLVYFTNSFDKRE